jgi:hypothetical protein
VSKFISLFVFIAFTASSFGQQVSDAIVVGTVLDSSQSAVQSATITLTHLATASAIQVRTDERGQYRTPPVRIGEYTISIEARGFKRFNQRGLVLDIGDTRQVDAVLQVGQVSDNVNVEAEAPLLQTADSTVGTVINNRQIEDLPLNGRDYLQLAALSSGTIATSQGVGIGGQAGTQASFLLDGQDNNNQEILTSHSGQKEIIKPSVDAIQEFKVVTNGYSAEYGRSSSGVVSVALKSGSNQFHGVAYEFLRNQDVDAKNLFAATIPPYKRNQFGATLGGPVIRNKTFFFADFELGRIITSTAVVSTVPTLAERQGIFPGAIYDPSSYDSATGTRTLFPGNTVPLSSWDPVSTKLLGYTPLPTTRTATNNYFYNAPANQSPSKWDFRIDQILSDKQNLYFRFSSQDQSNATTANIPPINGNYVTGSGAQTDNGKSFVLVHNAVWSANLVSSIRIGWNYLFWNDAFPNQSLTSVGIPGVNANYPGFSSIGLTNYLGLGVTNVPNQDGSQDRQLSGDLTRVKGAHSVKFGVQAYWLQTNFLSSQQSSGIFNFNGQYTRNSSTLANGNPFADFLLGDSSSESLSNFAYLQFRTPWTHFYVQDDWKISRRLTFNIGLRYEISLPAVEKNNKIANFDLDTTPGSPQLVLAGSQGSSWADRALQGTDYHQFAPRFGFAYSLPDNKTVLRGGYGIFYSNILTEGGMQSMEINPPNHLRVNLSTNPNVPSLLLSEGFAPNTLSTSNATNVELVSYDRNGVPPMAQEWNFDIQRQLPGGILVEIGYYGNKFDHAWWQLDGNAPPPEPGNVNTNRPFQSTLVPGEGTITLADVLRIARDGYSRYNALQAKVEKRYTKGLTFLASYSYSKTMGLGDTNGVQNPLDWNADRAVSNQDMTQHVVASTVYALPFGAGKTYGSHWNRFANALLGGWSVGPIVTVDTGMPLNLTVQGDPSNTGQQSITGNNDRPNVVGDWRLNNPTVQEWFNTAAFVPNAKYTFGDAGRNILRGPGLVNLDVAAHKSFRITERVSAQLRLESFNATNTPALGAPNVTVGSPQFGQITTAGAPRDNQVGLKVLF